MEINDKSYELSEKTPLELASNVHGLLAVKNDGSAGAVGLEEIANEAGKKVGDAVKIVGNVLPTMGDVNKRYTVTVGAGGLTLTYNGVPFVLTPNCQVDMFWDALAQTWEVEKQTVLPTTDTSGLVSKSSLEGNSLILPTSIYIINNTVINSLGAVLTNAAQYPNAKTILGFPLDPNTTYTIGGFLASNGKNFALADSTGAVINVGNLAILPKTFTTDATHTFLRCTIKQGDAVEPTDNNWINTLMLTKGDTLPLESAVRKIEGSILEAGVLSADNLTPTPTTAQNAVNLGYFNANSLKKSELVFKFSNNLARLVLNETVIPHNFINSTGGISAGMYWMMYKFYPLLNGLIAGDSFVVHNFKITGGGYVAWYEGNIMKSFEGAINGLTPKVFTVPQNATVNTILYFDISRPSDTGDNYENLTINAGTIPLPYVEPKITIIKIDQYEIGGGQSVSNFRDLTDVPQYTGNANKVLQINATEDGIEAVAMTNNGGDAVYDSVTTNFLVVADIPVWDEVSATDVVVGQEYLFSDGTNYLKKVRGV